MMNIETTQVSVELETSKVRGCIEEISNLISGIENVVGKVGAAIRKAFTPDIGNISDVQKTFQNVAVDLEAVANKMEEVVVLMTPQEESLVDGFLSGIDGFNTLVDGLGNLENVSESIGKGIKKASENKESFNIFKALVPESFDLAGELGGKISSGIKNMASKIDISSMTSGIVSFVKNVFAGDWGAAWDSIVSVFKGIWDYMVALAKAPVNGIIGLINGLVQGVVDGNACVGFLKHCFREQGFRKLITRRPSGSAKTPGGGRRPAEGQERRRAPSDVNRRPLHFRQATLIMRGKGV